MVKRVKTSRQLSAKKLYAAGFSIAEIADVLGVSDRTIQGYRKGENWDTLRIAKALEKGAGKTNLFSEFMEMMRQSAAEITANPKLNASEKTKNLASIGDAYSKMLKLAKMEDPEAYKLSIVKKTLFITLEHIKSALDSEAIERVVAIVDSAEFREALCIN